MATGNLDVTVRSCHFEYNRAFKEGGAIAIITRTGAKLQVTGSAEKRTRFEHNIAGNQGSSIQFKSIHGTNVYPPNFLNVIEESVEPFKSSEDQNYPVIQARDELSILIEHTDFYSPSSINAVGIEGAHLLRVNDVEFLRAYEFEEAIGLHGASIFGIGLIQMKIINSRFDHQVSQVTGGAISLMSAFDT